MSQSLHLLGNKRKSNVLIVLEGNRFVRVFGDQDTNVKIVQVPFYFSAKGELLVEELLQQRLPHYWKQVLDNRLIGMQRIRDISADDILARNMDLAVLKAIERHEVRA